MVTAETIANCPTFIDLAALSESVPTAEGGNPFGGGAKILPVRAGDCEVFVTVLAAGEGLHREDRGDTWLLAIEGCVRLQVNGSRILLSEGESLVVARGAGFDWATEGPARLVGMRYLEAREAGGGIVPIDNAAPLSPSNPPADDVLLGEKPSCRSGNQFASADGVFKCGIWDSTPYRRLPIHFHHSELMHLLAGSVTFTDAAGRTATFGKGDTFIIEKGADCSWDSTEYVAKIYAYYRA